MDLRLGGQRRQVGASLSSFSRVLPEGGGPRHALALQGCNLALESCRALGAAACDLDAAPKRYSDARVADAHAFQDLEVMQVQRRARP